MRILGYDYLVSVSGDSDEMDAYGRFIPKTHKIQLSSDLCQQAQVSTLLHEVLEALNYHLQLRLEHNVIQSLESGLFQVLTDSGVDLTPLTSELMSRDATE